MLLAETAVDTSSKAADLTAKATGHIADILDYSSHMQTATLVAVVVLIALAALCYFKLVKISDDIAKSAGLPKS